MIKRFLNLLFGDVGLLISSAISGGIGAALLPIFFDQLHGDVVILSTLFAALFGILSVAFFASSVISALFLAIRSGITKRWVLFSLSLLILIVDAVALVLALIFTRG